MGDPKKKRQSRKGVKTPRPGLTAKQHKFVENIAKDLPLKVAVEDAGYSPECSAAMGIQLMNKPHIKEAINKRKLEAAEYAKVTPEMVMGATVKRAFCSIDDAFDEDGNFDLQLARETGAIHLIKKYKKRNGNIEVEFYDNAEAQNKLANYLGMDMAPKANNDATSLKQGVEQVAQALAGVGNPVTPEHRKQAWEAVQEWVVDSKSRYSPEAIQEVSKEYAN